MARSKFSQAIHQSIRRQMHQFQESGKIGGKPIKNKDEAVKIAAQNAYSRVRTQPETGDIGPRS